MNKTSKISRSKFIKWIFNLLLIPFAFLWYKSVRTQQEKQKSKLILPVNLPEGISFHGKVITNKSPGKLEILSSRCTHLGCTVNKIENEHLVCPCHGSVYSLHGKVIKGPASKPLTELPFTIDKKKGEIIVELV